MNLKVLLLLFLISQSLFSIRITAQILVPNNVSNIITIGKWKDFKPSAYSPTFDDGTDIQFYGALPILDSLNIKSTLYITTGKRDSSTWHYLNEEAKKGHEIGSHTITHKVLTDASPEELKYELIESKRSIIRNIPAQTGSFSFCYPGGPTNDFIIEEVVKHYLAARTVAFGVNTDTTNLYRLYNAWTQPPVKNAYNELKSHLTSLKNNPNNVWLIHMFHGFDGKNFEPIPLSVFRRIMIEIARDSNRIWIAPVRDVVKYMLERKSAVISIDSLTNNKLDFKIRHSLSDSSYNYPLSIRVLLPLEWTHLIVKQGNRIIPFQKKTILDNHFAFFNVMPGEEKISVANILPSDLTSYNLSVRTFPVPFVDNLFIELVSPQNDKAKVTIFDSNGGEEYSEIVYFNSGLNSLYLNTSNFCEGIKTIHIRFEGSNLQYTGKILKIK